MTPASRIWHSSARGIILVVILAILAPVELGLAQESRERPPIVVEAAVPLYPPLARQARIEGVVRLEVVTNGERISETHVVSGHPLLAQASKQNVETWRFKPTKSKTFGVTFRYKILPDSGCDVLTNNSTVLLRLPTEVEVSAEGTQTCDPTETIH
jgi:hypothetical protein